MFFMPRRRPLLRFCVARLGPDRGEDVFQETLLSALAHYEQLRDPMRRLHRTA